ncbi:DUF4240 domain-containing protein [Paractinoplanes hotanensis]|uniref:DUF4240 domain-containing protein n=1 Tax=Paractinoplanes hotanensis TaxID=2906497 RepID=A0ABT0YAK3_9ACTN|nr:DUF4240 domain-containing protein [Actinoplanes hotanensis]MCM4083068.1 DUF4240 domain-containing protein [Actinoplanes hotanensis]
MITPITGFADQLALMLGTLDIPAHLTAAHTVSSDVFIYVRCVLVAAGRRTRAG